MPAVDAAALDGLPEVAVPDGTDVLVQGQPHDDVLVLVRGAVRVSVDGVEIRVIDEPGAIFGEMAVLLGTPATATATTVGDCVFRRSADPERLMLEHPGFALDVARTLAARLDLVSRYLVDLRQQYADRSDHLGVVDVVLGSLLQHQTSDVEPGSEREPEAPY